MSAKRYFEFSEGTSNKFWEVWREGAQVFTRYGKIGSSGQTTIKDEGSDEKGQKLYDKLVREKTGKGYQEKTDGATGPTTPAPAPAAPKPAKASAPPPAKAAAPAKAAPAPAAAAAPSAPAGTRRFEFSEGSSNKFWQIKVEGKQNIVTYGKLGTNGQEQVKDFASEAAAQKEADKLIAEKTKKGYVEKVVEEAAPIPPLDPAELKQHLAPILKAPESMEARAVFGDWLQSKDHPWGQLLALQRAKEGADSKKLAQLEKEEVEIWRKAGTAIVGSIARVKGTEFEWKQGFITKATLAMWTDKPPLAESLKTLLASPAAALVEAIVFAPVPKDLASHRDWDASVEDIFNPWEDLLKGLDLPERVTHVGFGQSMPGSPAAYVQLPSFTKVSKAVSGHVKTLELSGIGNEALGTFNLPELEQLEVRFANADSAGFEAIASSKLPKLTHLSVWLGGEANCTLDDVHPAAEYDEDDDEGGSRYPARYPATDIEGMEVYDINPAWNAAGLATFLNGKLPGAIKHLGIKSGLFNEAEVKAIVTSKVIPQLTTLDLSLGTMGESGLKALLEAKAQLKHLESINLEGNLLTADQVKKLKAELPNAKPGAQRKSDDGVPQFFMRYVAGME